MFTNIFSMAVGEDFRYESMQVKYILVEAFHSRKLLLTPDHLGLQLLHGAKGLEGIGREQMIVFAMVNKANSCGGCSSREE